MPLTFRLPNPGLASLCVIDSAHPRAAEREIDAEIEVQDRTAMIVVGVEPAP